MDIYFRDQKLGKLCNDRKLLEKKMGADSARRIQRRLDDLRAAHCLEDMRHLPGRTHELTSDLAGHLSIDLVHPYRLLFIPYNDPLPTKSDGGIDWNEVTAIEIVEIRDTHE
jgi:plasmid maintenance system killer protein